MASFFLGAVFWLLVTATWEQSWYSCWKSAKTSTGTSYDWAGGDSIISSKIFFGSCSRVWSCDEYLNKNIFNYYLTQIFPCIKLMYSDICSCQVNKSPKLVCIKRIYPTIQMYQMNISVSNWYIQIFVREKSFLVSHSVLQDEGEEELIQDGALLAFLQLNGISNERFISTEYQILYRKNLVSEKVLDSFSFRFWVFWVKFRFRNLVYFLKGFGFGIKKFGIKKSIRFGIKNIRYRKSIGFGIRKNWYPKKVSDSIPFRF